MRALGEILYSDISPKWYFFGFKDLLKVKASAFPKYEIVHPSEIAVISALNDEADASSAVVASQPLSTSSSQRRSQMSTPMDMMISGSVPVLPVMTLPNDRIVTAIPNDTAITKETRSEAVVSVVSAPVDGCIVRSAFHKNWKKLTERGWSCASEGESKVYYAPGVAETSRDGAIKVG